MSALATIVLATLLGAGEPSLAIGAQDGGAAQVADDDAEIGYESLVPS